MKPYYFECHCHSPEHTLIFRLDEEEPKTLYGYVFLNSDSLFKRIWKAIKYVFGFKCRYGHFDEFILNPKDAQKMIDLLSKIANPK